MKILILIALLAVTVNAQKVKVSSDPACDFSKYKTYACDEGTLDNPLIKQYIVTAVDKHIHTTAHVDAGADQLVAEFAKWKPPTTSSSSVRPTGQATR